MDIFIRLHAVGAAAHEQSVQFPFSVPGGFIEDQGHSMDSWSGFLGSPCMVQ